MSHCLWGFLSVFVHDFLEGQALCNKARPGLPVIQPSGLSLKANLG